MRKRKPEESLEDYLNDRTIPDDPELASLARTADRLERGLNVEAPEAYRERALFIQGVASRKPGFPWARLMVPVMAASLFVVFVALGRDAQPGDALYGFRKTLDRVGLAENPARSARDVLDEAADQVAAAETYLDVDRYERAKSAALDALIILEEADGLLEDGSGEFLETQTERYEDLSDRAIDVIEDAIKEVDDLAEERREEAQERREEAREGSEDNSGKGGGDDDSGDDDSSGSGSGDDDSGGDDSSGDDSSGSGSDDSGGDDSSGSGSGGDDSGRDDSSGSGSDDN